MLTIAIAGAGWYGCHVASTLAAVGIGVEVFEAAPRVFDAASGNNQFRLHMGFHYPRSHRTRLQSRDGYARFVERYAFLSEPVADNFYAVPELESWLDFPSYRMVMSAAGIEFREASLEEAAARGWCRLDGLLRCEERVIRTARAREYFQRRLGDTLHLGTPVTSVEQRDDAVLVNGRRFDFLVDCTWGHLTRTGVECYYEPTILLYYRGEPDHPALTLVDGPLPSLYRTEERGRFTLSSVLHTPLGRYPSAAEAVARRDSVDSALVAEKRAAMEAQISAFIPDFRDRFAFDGVQLAVKTKPLGRSDDRSCSVTLRGRVFTMLSGKIDTIFFGAQDVIAKIEGILDSPLDQDRPLTLAPRA